MKRILTLWVLALAVSLNVWTAWADGTPGYPASQSAVNAGSDPYGWVTPATLMNWSGAGTGPTNGITTTAASNIVNNILVRANLVTNGTSPNLNGRFITNVLSAVQTNDLRPLNLLAANVYFASVANIAHSVVALPSASTLSVDTNNIWQFALPVNAPLYTGAFVGNGAGLTNVSISVYTNANWSNGQQMFDSSYGYDAMNWPNGNYLIGQNGGYYFIDYPEGNVPLAAYTPGVGEQLFYPNGNQLADNSGNLYGSASGLSNLSVGGISATGTRSSTTFLNGLGQWATPAGGGGGVVQYVFPAYTVPFTPFALSTTCSNYGSGYAPAQYMKAQSGWVYFNGTIKGASTDQNIGLLPYPCSPNNNIIMQGIDGGNAGNVLNWGINSNSQVNVNTVSGTYDSFSTAYFVSGTYGTFFGDSITAGTGVTSQANRFSTVLSAAMGWIEDNQGIGGTEFQDSTGSANSGFSTRVARCTGHYPNYAVILYGINDIDHTSGLLNTNTYQAELTSTVLQLETNGISPYHIILSSITFVDTNAQANSLNGFAATGNSAGTLAKDLAYNLCISNTAMITGAQFVDNWTAMQTGGGTALLFDGLHPTNSGAYLIATNIAAHITAAPF